MVGASLAGNKATLIQARIQRDASFENVKQTRSGWQPGPGAARVDDQVKHKSFLAALAGAVVGAALTIATGIVVVAAFSLAFPASLLVGGLALVAAFKAAPLIDKLSEGVTNFVDGLFTSPDGAIITGSPNVVINKKKAARAGVTLPTEPVEVSESAPTDFQGIAAALGEGNYADAASHLPGALAEGVSNAPGWINDAANWADNVTQKNKDTILGRNDASVMERLEAASSWLIGGPVTAELITMAGGHGGIKRDVDFPEAPGDTSTCKEGKPPRIAQGSGSVFINGQPAARKDDKLECSAIIKTGSENVFIGGGQLTCLDIDAEFPPWMRKVLGVINIASYLLPPSSLGQKLAGRLAGGVSKLLGRLPRLRGALLGAQRALAAVRNGPSKVATHVANFARPIGEKARNGFARVKRWIFDPVDIATGAYTEMRTDIRLGQTLPLEFIRYYDSTESHAGLLGKGWSDNWSEYALVSELGSFIDIFDYTGQVYSFNFMPDEDIACNASYSHLTLRRRGNVLELFDAQTLISRYFYDAFNHRQMADGEEKRHFYLGAMTDVNNNKLYFERNDAAQIVGVIHTDGIRLRLHYHPSGYLHKIIRYTGELEVLAEYHQDEHGRLTEADIAREFHLFYQYDADHRLVRWADNDQTWVNFRYDAQGRCISTQGAQGYYSGTLSYGDDYTDVADGRGQRTRYWRDALYNITAEETQDGRITRYTYDDDRNITSRTTPQGRQTFYEYVPHTQLLRCYTDESGSQWQYEYNYQGRLSKVTDPQGHEWRQAYDALGKPVHMISPNGDKTQFHYHADGLLAAIVHPDSSSQRYRWDAHKRLSQITDEAGRHYQFGYNKRDQPQTLVQPGQSQTHFHWQHQRLKAVIHPDQTKKSYRYDRHGNLLSYVDQAGYEWQLEYGPFDMPVARTDAPGNRWRYVYDTVTAQLAQVINPQGESWRYTYNAQGQVEREEDYGGAVWHYAYDEDGHCISRTDGQGQAITFDYNARGQCIAAHSEEGTTYYHYSDTGQLLSTQKDGDIIAYEYDEALRLAREIHPAHEITYRYPSRHSIEREICYTSEDGGRHTLKTTFRRNAVGELVQLALPENAALDLAYDACGNEVRRSADSGFMLCQYYDGMNRAVRRRAGRQPRLLLDANEEKEIPYPILASQDRVYHYDVRGSIVAVNDDEGLVRYQLNGNGQVTAVEYPLESEQYGYDECGYVTEQRLPYPFRHSDNTHYVEGHRLSQRGDEWFEYDRCGRMCKRVLRQEGYRPLIYTYQWNSLNQLTGFKKPDGEVWQYKYDARGRRTEKSCERKKCRTVYLWDNDTIAVIREYRDERLWRTRHQVFNGFELLAQQDCYTDEGVWQTHYASTDLNGLPLALYTPEGHQVWRKRHTTLWGLRPERMRHLAEDRLDPGLLFAGQMEDKESGLVYNRFRYYHPESGTYLSPDPIGLAGGLNTYAYAPNPLNWVDPLGLSKCSASGKYKPETILGRTVYKNTVDISPNAPGFVHPSVHRSIRQKVADGWTNLDLMKNGYAPIGPDGKQMNLHHVLGQEPGPMAELVSSTHKQYHKELHGLIEDGRSFRHDGSLNYQYDTFRNKYWALRAQDFM
ncbi:YD repeat-containing protein [Erwinia tracheiphila PSU-1]|nr:YD repeat-containing protein [Erwinia tracheiphila PSU-1]